MVAAPNDLILFCFVFIYYVNDKFTTHLPIMHDDHFIVFFSVSYILIMVISNQRKKKNKNLYKSCLSSSSSSLLFSKIIKMIMEQNEKKIIIAHDDDDDDEQHLKNLSFPTLYGNHSLFYSSSSSIIIYCISYILFFRFDCGQICFLFFFLVLDPIIINHNHWIWWIESW